MKIAGDQSNSLVLEILHVLIMYRVNFLSMRNIIIFIFLNTVFNQNNFNH